MGGSLLHTKNCTFPILPPTDAIRRASLFSFWFFFFFLVKKEKERRSPSENAKNLSE
jgi:hypothetical protein